MEGTIKWFDTTKGFGFIHCEEEGKDYFVHHSALPEGMQLNEGDKVTFDPVETEKGVQAQNVKLV
jgi:cold shock protein